MNILALYNSQSGCCFHRVYGVLRHFPLQDGDKLQMVDEKSMLYEQSFADCDIVFFNRLPHFISNEKLFELKKKHGFKLCVDLDDYFSLYYHHIQYYEWKKHNVTERIIECLLNADLVTVTNYQLWKEVKSITDAQVEILPNALPLDIEQYGYTPVKHEGFNVIYTGGNSHFPDLKSISGMFHRLGSDGEWLKQGKFIFAGYNNPNNSQTSIYWKMLGIIRPIRNYELKAPLSVHKYMSFYDEADISIAPLEDNKFNGFKSVLKIIEAGHKKLPILCTDNLPYSELNGVEGVTLCHTSNDFYKKIKYLLRNPLKCQEEGLALHNYITEHFNYKQINKQRYELFKSLL